MASRIDLNLSHSYLANPQQDSDYALLPLNMSFRAGGAYALLGPSGRSEEHTSELQSH